MPRQRYNFAFTSTIWSLTTYSETLVASVHGFHSTLGSLDQDLLYAVDERGSRSHDCLGNRSTLFMCHPRGINRHGRDIVFSHSETVIPEKFY